MVVAKFYTQSNAHQNQANGTEQTKSNTIQMFPVTATSEENKEFFKWSPGGDLKLNTINPGAAEQFVPGEEKFVVFMSPEEYARFKGPIPEAAK